MKYTHFDYCETEAEKQEFEENMRLLADGKNIFAVGKEHVKHARQQFIKLTRTYVTQDDFANLIYEKYHSDRELGFAIQFCECWVETQTKNNNLLVTNSDYRVLRDVAIGEEWTIHKLDDGAEVVDILDAIITAENWSNYHESNLTICAEVTGNILNPIKQ